MKRNNKFLIALSTVLLSVSLAGCSSSPNSSKDGVNRTSPDGNEVKVEHAAIKLAKNAEKNKYKLIDAEGVKKVIDAKEDVVIVNVIPADRFASTKIPNAVNAFLPKKLDEVKPEEKENFLKQLGDNKDKKIIVYCGYVECDRSDVGAKLAIDAGYKNVYRFPGGIAAWLDAGNSVAK